MTQRQGILIETCLSQARKESAVHGGGVLAGGRLAREEQAPADLSKVACFVRANST